MAFIADLDEKESVAECIDDLLPAATVPPFDGVVVLAAGGDYPVGTPLAEQLLDRAGLSFLPLAEMDVAFEFRRANFEIKLLVEEFDKAVNEVIGRGIGLVNQGIMAA